MSAFLGRIAPDAAKAIAAPVVGALCLGVPSVCQAGVPSEFFNEFDWAPATPVPGPTNFEIMFAGDATCLIPQQNQNDHSTDPFKGANPITTTYDPISNTTTVSYSGSALKPGQRYHFGLNQGFAPTPPLQVVGKMWTYATAAPAPLPIVTVTPPLPLTGPFLYAIVYLEAAFQPGGQTYGSWYEVPYSSSGTTATTQPTMTYSNFGTQPLYISNTGIQVGLPVPTSKACATDPTCNANTKLLKDLDFKKTPPPGQPGTKFVPITSPPPAVLQPTAVSAPASCKSG
jgi:hypothetical protein